MNDQVQATEVKKAKFCEKSAEGTVVSFKFGNDTVVSLDLDTLSEEMQQELMIHGALQKIGDSYSSAGGDFAFGIAAAEKVIDNLKNGAWGSARAGSGESKKASGELANALAALQGKDIATVVAALDAATDEQKKALRAHPAVKAKIAELRAAKAQEALAKAGEAGVLSF
jgi:hypothetical protein